MRQIDDKKHDAQVIFIYISFLFGDVLSPSSANPVIFENSPHQRIPTSLLRAQKILLWYYYCMLV